MTGLAGQILATVLIILLGVLLPVWISKRGLSLWRPIDIVLASAIAVVFTAPFLGNFSGYVSYIRLGIGMLAAALLALGMISRNRDVGKAHLLILLFVVFQAIPLLESQSGSLAILRLANLIVFVPFALFAYDKLAIRRLFASATAVFGILLLGLLLQLQGRLGGTWGGVLTEGTTYNPVTSRWLQRYTSFLFNPNDFGLAMACAAIMFLGALLLSRRLVVRAVAAGLSSLAVAGLLLSSSRGGYLAFAVGLFAMSLATRSRRLTALLVLAVLSSAAIVLTVPKLNASTQATVASIGALWSGTDKSAVQRRELWSKRASTATVSGLGYGGNADLSNIDINNGAARAKAYSAQTVDNSWLKLFIEEGLIGLVLLMSIVGIAMSRAWRAARSQTADAGTAVVLLAILSAFLFRSLSVDILDINPWNWFVWLLVGLALSLRAQPEPGANQDVALRAYGRSSVPPTSSASSAPTPGWGSGTMVQSRSGG